MENDADNLFKLTSQLNPSVNILKKFQCNAKNL